MTNDEHGTPGRETSGAAKGPQTLAQLQATGAEVVGSDGKKVGDLKEVGDADFVVGRTLKSDLRLSVNQIREIIPEDGGNKIVLELPAEEAKDASRSGASGDGDPAADFSETTERDQGS